METKRKIKAVIFDLDGTIADTLGSLQLAVNRTLDVFSHPNVTREHVRRAIGGGARAFVEGVLPDDMPHDEKYVDNVLSIYDGIYRECFLECRECFDGVRELVDACKREGLLLAVLSNKQDYQTKALVKSLFAEGLFADVRGQTDLPKKPDPTVPLMMADALGVDPSECAYVGDSEVDYKTALNSGMIPVIVGWGYRTEEELRSNGVEEILKTAVEVAEKLGVKM